MSNYKYIYVILFSLFGPYLNDYGVRTDHIVLYGLTFVTIILTLGGDKVFLGPHSYFFPFVIILFYIVYSIVIVFFSGRDPIYQSMIAFIDNYIQIILVLFLTFSLMRKVETHHLIEIFNKIILFFIIIVMIASIIAIYTFIVGSPPKFVELFQSKADAGLGRMLWERSLRTGRFVSIFGSPFEAGIAISMALLSASYLFKSKCISLSFYALSIVLLFIFGILTISKVFFVGFLLFVIFNYRSVALYYFLLAFILLTALYLNFLSSDSTWVGQRFYSAYFGFDDSMNFVNRWTAGRYGENSGVSFYFDKIYSENGLIGYGADYIGVVDSFVTEAFSKAGLLGVILYSFILFWLLIKSSRKVFSVNYSRYIRFLVFVMIIASLGAPAITKNHVGPFFWMIFSFHLILLSRISYCNPPKN
jgi:hypothetical protein